MNEIVKEILRTNYITGNADDFELSCETEEEFTNRVAQQICQLFEREELKLRGLLWASHRCSGKYCDDGELQCGRFLPTIDFKRDSAEEIERKVPLHYHQLFEPKSDIDRGMGRIIPKKPKPDEGRLLTDKECLDAEDEAAKYWDDNIDAIDIPGKYAYCRVAIAKKQRDLTASIKDNDNILLLQYAEEKYPELLTDANWVNIKQSRWSQWQLDKVKESVNVTAIIKDAECQARVERLIEWGGERCLEHHTRMNNVLHRTCNECWQALKEGVK